jgi:N-methylhydantoinase A
MKSSLHTYKLGFDIGGTFTDFILLNEKSGEIYSYKILTTPEEPSEAVINGIKHLIEKHNIDPQNIVHTTHATTLITNAFIERKGSKTALICTSGFSDIIEIGNEMRYDIYDLLMELPEPIVSRNNRFEVDERITASGDIFTKLNTSQLNKIVHKIKNSNIEAVGICFLHSYKNNVHENKAKKIINEKLKNISVSVSNEVSPEIREYERISTTVCNAYVQPLVSKYLKKLIVEQKKLNLKGELSLMLSSGGITDIQTAIDFPINLVESGPAAGVLSAIYYGKQINEKNILSFDMGGTTAKMGLIKDGKPTISDNFEIGRVRRFKKGSGLPVKIPTIELIEIGAGGGSIAHVDELGLLKVGPESAGADPGPACYEKGNKFPTVTDANLVLGIINPDNFLGGRMKLNIDLSKDVINENIANKLKISLIDSALGIYKIVNESMISATRVHIAERGSDPRKLILIAFGGAGPIHAHSIARSLKMKGFVCPAKAGVASTVGFLNAPVSYDYFQSFISILKIEVFEKINNIYETMKKRGLDTLLRSSELKKNVRFILQADMRHKGQGHEILVDINNEDIINKNIQIIKNNFYKSYEKVYGFSHNILEIEITKLRLKAIGKTPKFNISEENTDKKSQLSKRHIYLSKGKPLLASIYKRADLSEHKKYYGPAVIEEIDSTVVIPNNCSFTKDNNQNIIAKFK